MDQQAHNSIYFTKMKTKMIIKMQVKKPPVITGQIVELNMPI